MRDVTTWQQTSPRLLLLLPHALCLLTAALLLISTPTLNVDDLQIAEWAPAALSEGWSKALTTVFFNIDLGVWQPRTYGLARTIQYIEAGLFGSAPVPAYLFIVLAHFGSGALIYHIVKRAAGDQVVGIFAAVAWMASPAVLPMLKVQHHFLYLVAPYYPLFAWMLLFGGHPDTNRFWSGSALLTAAWLLGEGVTIPIAVVVIASTTIHGSGRKSVPLLGQGVIAGLLLLAYMGYQHVFVRDPSVPARFVFAPDLGLFKTFLVQLRENGRAVLGLSHYDSELHTTLGVIGILDSAAFWVLSAALISFGVVAARALPCTSAAREPGLGLLVVLAWLASLGLYVFFMVAGMGAFPARYAAAFFALMPVALIVGLALYAPNRTARLAGAAIASVSVALTLTSLYRAEILVSRPNRILLDELNGRAVVLRPDAEFTGEFGAIPGLVSIHGNLLPDPMRSLWTTEVVLRRYAGATLGNACHRVSTDNDKMELTLRGRSQGVYASEDLVVMDSPLTLVQACRTISPTALAAGQGVMKDRIRRKVDAYTEIVPTETFRYFMHPTMEKDAVMEFDVSDLSSLTLSPWMGRINGGCVADAKAGMIELSYAIDERDPVRIAVDRRYDELTVVELAGATRMTFVVNQANDSIACDWFELGFLNVRGR